jgi:TetR/AcrR family transcriptional repressor of nem operon
MPWEKQFDRGAALSAAEEVFWEKGYEATSLDTLLQRMGIQKGSFYATFGSKHKILMESLELYILERFNSFNRLALQYPPLEALEQHFDLVLEECRCEKPSRGCFLVNAAIELAPSNAEVAAVVQQTMEAHEAFYRKQLAKAKADNRLPKNYDVNGGASALIGLLMGMRVLARAGMPPATLDGLHRQAIATFKAKRSGSEH